MNIKETELSNYIYFIQFTVDNNSISKAIVPNTIVHYYLWTQMFVRNVSFEKERSR